MCVAELAACRLCHQRKVKCDKSRPGCRRCVRYGQPCPGYQKVAKTIFYAYEPDFGPITSSTALRRQATSSGKVPAQSAREDVTDSSDSSSPDATYRMPKHYTSDLVLPNSGCDSGHMNLHTSISSRHLYRQQFLMRFLHMHTKGDSITLLHNSELKDMPAIEITSPSVQAALDTLCYVGLGTAYQDRRLLEEARVKYSHAVKLLNRELDLAPKNTRFRSTVSSMMILRLCELFDTFAHGTENIGGWHLHLHAVQQYMKACGPENLLKTEYDWNLYQTVRFCALYLDVARRKPSMFERPEWRALTRDRAKIDAGVALYDLRARIPGLLARAEALVENTTLAQPELIRLLTNLYTDQQHLLTDFDDWMQTFGTNAYDTRTIPENNRTTPGAPCNTYYHFKSTLSASHATTFWMLSLALSSSILRLLCRYPCLPSPYNISSVREDAYTSALHLYKSAYWCFQPEVAQTPCVGAFHLRFARAWFQTENYHDEVAWCEALLERWAMKDFEHREGREGGVQRLMLGVSQKDAADGFCRGVLGVGLMGR